MLPQPLRCDTAVLPQPLREGALRGRCVRLPARRVRLRIGESAEFQAPLCLCRVLAGSVHEHGILAAPS